MTSPGFSSRSTSSTVRQFPQRDEVAMSEMTPGWSNAGAVRAEQPEPAEAETKVVEAPASESKTVRKRTAKKQD